MKAEDALELLIKMIATPSLSRDEGGVADLLAKYVEREGYAVNRKGNNLWVKSHHWDDSHPTLLLDGHIDTVKPADGWEGDPFKPEVKGERLYGLGSNDCGGSVVSLLAAFTELDSHPQSYNMVWSASAEEEVTGADGIRASLKEMPHIDMAIVGEPTGMQPAVSERGLLVLDCKVFGKTGHAARNEGVNAIYEALPVIEWFKDHQFERVSPMLGPVKMTVTVINSGTLHNVVPAECDFVVDVRVNECYSNEELFEEILKGVSGVMAKGGVAGSSGGEVATVAGATGNSAGGATTKPGFEIKARSFLHKSSSIPLNHPLVRRCVEMGLKPFGSPTTSNMTAMNFPALKMGPGESARSHTANEFILVDEIYDAIALYTHLLDGVNLNGK